MSELKETDRRLRALGHGEMIKNLVVQGLVVWGLRARV